MNQAQRHNEKKVNVAVDRRRDLAKIHIAKKQLGLDETAYREMLSGIAGVESAADLDCPGRRRVIAHLKSCGFQPMHKSARASGMHRPPAKEKAPMISKIHAILIELSLPWSYADAMARKMFRVDRLRWLHTEQLHKLTAALIYHQKRARKRGNKNGY